MGVNSSVKEKHFCDRQVEPSDKPNELYCAAHLHEEHCFKCPYTKKDIHYGTRLSNENQLYISKNELESACNDFKPVKNLLEILGIGSFEELLRKKPYWGRD